MSVAVIIPYYQRAHGILRRALESVLAQQFAGPCEVLVVDDSSPVPAGPEIEGLSPPSNMTIRCIRQPNGGPGAARNAALNILDNTTDYVAFLDSDDTWSPLHLARAVETLDTGCDVYFSDHFQLGQSVSAFVRSRRLDGGAFEPVGDGDREVFAYAGDMVDQIMFGNVIGTSTVTYNFSRYSGIRFREEYRRAGEDYLFWLDLAASNARFAFSRQVECTYGSGVNVYAGAGWGSDGHARRTYDELRYRQALGKLYVKSQSQDVRNAAVIARLREEFAKDLLHRLSGRKPVEWGVVKSFIAADPLVLAQIPVVALGSITSKLTS